MEGYLLNKDRNEYLLEIGVPELLSSFSKRIHQFRLCAANVSS